MPRPLWMSRLTGVLLVMASAPAASAEDPVAVTVEAPRQLRLGKRGYQGKIKVTLQNRGSAPLTLHHGEENHLVFEAEDGKLDVICHPCACVQDGSVEGARGPFSVTLPPDGKKELVFEDWGCSGSAWRGPPPGSYRVTYRVFVERRHPPASPRTCCEALRAADYWKGAVSSAPAKLSIVLSRKGK